MRLRAAEHGLWLGLPVTLGFSTSFLCNYPGTTARFTNRNRSSSHDGRSLLLYNQPVFRDQSKVCKGSLLLRPLVLGFSATEKQDS